MTFKLFKIIIFLLEFPQSIFWSIIIILAIPLAIPVLATPWLDHAAIISYAASFACCRTRLEVFLGRDKERFRVFAQINPLTGNSRLFKVILRCLITSLIATIHVVSVLLLSCLARVKAWTIPLFYRSTTLSVTLAISRALLGERWCLNWSISFQ